MISEPMVCLVQTMHQSYTNTHKVSKQIKTRIDMTHVIKQFHRAPAEQFLSPWHVRHKPCTYLAPTLTLSPNGLPLEPCHLGVPSGASKKISEPTVHLVQSVHLSCTDTNTVSKWTNTTFTWALSTRSTIGCIRNVFWAYGMFGANRAPILHQH
jgi:hypothetical protein